MWKTKQTNELTKEKAMNKYKMKRCGVGTLGASLRMWCREVCSQQLYKMVEQNDEVEGGNGRMVGAIKKMKEIKGTRVHMGGLSKIS